MQLPWQSTGILLDLRLLGMTMTPGELDAASWEQSPRAISLQTGSWFTCLFNILLDYSPYFLSLKFLLLETKDYNHKRLANNIIVVITLVILLSLKKKITHKLGIRQAFPDLCPILLTDPWEAPLSYLSYPDSGIHVSTSLPL